MTAIRTKARKQLAESTFNMALLVKWAGIEQKCHLLESEFCVAGRA